jgi:hypothetical protein
VHFDFPLGTFQVHAVSGAAAGAPHNQMDAPRSSARPRKVKTMKDNLTQAGAESLRRKLEGYWRSLSSAAAFNFWIVPQGAEMHTVWCVRSSLVRGLPGPLLTQASTSNTTQMLGERA